MYKQKGWKKKAEGDKSTKGDEWFKESVKKE
jgi:hypothetical protein